MSHAQEILAAQARVAAGREAFAAGVPESANPHAGNAGAQWRHGWREAAAGAPWSCYLTDEVLDIDTADEAELRAVLDTLGAPSGAVLVERDKHPRIRQWRVTVSTAR